MPLFHSRRRGFAGCGCEFGHECAIFGWDFRNRNFGCGFDGGVSRCFGFRNRLNTGVLNTGVTRLGTRCSFDFCCSFHFWRIGGLSKDFGRCVGRCFCNRFHGVGFGGSLVRGVGDFRRRSWRCWLGIRFNRRYFDGGFGGHCRNRRHRHASMSVKARSTAFSVLKSADASILA